MAALIAILAVFGGGKSSPLDDAATLIQFHGPGENNERNFHGAMRVESFGAQTLIAADYRPEYDTDLAPAPTWPLAATIEATPTPAAIAPTVVAAAVSEGHGTGCPAIIVETFGENAPAACAVAWCESRWHPGAVGDGGNSLGLFQLWTGWAAWYGVPVEALYDPVTNTTVARAVLDYRGRWGGSGGWTCADILGIW